MITANTASLYLLLMGAAIIAMAFHIGEYHKSLGVKRSTLPPVLAIVGIVLCIPLPVRLFLYALEILK